MQSLPRAKKGSKSFALPMPRPKIRRYKYVRDENPDLSKIVFDIINGLPIEQVEPEIYPFLLPHLRDRERALKEWRNQPASRALEAAIDYIQNYRYCNDPNQLQPRTMRSLHVNANTLSETELNLTVNLAMRGEFSQIDPKHYRVIIKELQRIRTEALSDGDYLLAERAVNASRRVLALSSENRFAEIATAKVDSLAMQLRGKLQDRDLVLEDCEQRIREAEKKRDADLRQIERENEEELREFDKQFEEKAPPRFRKFSPTILDLRTREHYMVQAGRYAEATEVREEADRLEAVESEEHERRWIEELKLKRQELIKKQEERMFVRKMNGDILIEKRKKANLTAIDHQEKSLQHIEHHLNGAVAVQNLGNSPVATTRGVMSARGHRPQLQRPKQTRDPEAMEFRRKAMINTIVYSKAGVKVT
jgi:hypothetical protein